MGKTITGTEQNGKNHTLKFKSIDILTLEEENVTKSRKPHLTRWTQQLAAAEEEMIQHNCFVVKKNNETEM